MGQAGSQPGEPRARRVHTLPHEPLRLAPKVLPSLTESPRLRSTDNGAILHSGGTISGRRPGSILQESRIPHGHVHSNVYRSRSAGGGGEIDIRSRERDPLHRSHTNLDFRHNDSNGMNKRFGSEPDLRVEEEQPKSRNNNNKHFRKKYKAPQPPSNHLREGSSPDSREGNANFEPQRKLRLFRTRNETKKLNGHMDSKIPVYKNTYTDFKSLDLNDHFGRRYKSPCKDKEQCVSYVESKDMVQSSTSLQKEERLLQDKQDYRKARTDRISGCRAKTSKTNETEAWKTPLLNKNFRYSERFKNDQPILRREKTFDDTLTTSERENESPRALHEKRTKALGEELTNKLSPLGQRNQPLRKSLPSLLNKSNEEKDEFQEELKKATSRIRKELGNKLNVSENTSQNVKTQKPNPSKPMTPKVKESSPKVSKPEPKPINTRRPLCRVIEKTQNNKIKSDVHYKSDNKENKKVMPDRGQASGKESTPEHSPTRKKETSNAAPEKQRPAPSKQFYFGMIESKKTEPQDHLKDFPGLGSPIIEEFTNFHLIEKKLLGYHEEDEMEKFNEKFKEDCKRNLSSESALSSDGSEEGSEGSLGITLRLRPTLPKKLPTNARFSPTSAWRQLASLDAHFAETQPLAVEIKMSGDLSPESSPRSEQSADKSGDSGISGDHGHSDHRIDSPGHAAEAAWTPQQDLGDSSSDGTQEPLRSGVTSFNPAYTTYNPGAPFSLSLPRDDKGKQLQQGFNSLQKLRKSVSGALGAALGSRRFDLEHEPMLEEPEQNWFLTKSAPNSLSNPLLYHQPLRTKVSEDIGKEEPSLISEKGPDENRWRSSYVKWGGHVMYLPPAPDQPLSMLGTAERPIRSKSSGCLEASARAARAALAGEMRERERSASPDIARAVPARVEPVNSRTSNAGRGKRFTFQSTVRQLERRRIAEKLSREADLKEQQRRTELEAMRRVEEEFQRKRAREKANIRQQLRLVSSGANSMPPSQHSKSRDEPDGSCRGSPAPDRTREPRVRHSNSSEGSGRSKSSTPIRSVELSEWRTEGGARVYRDWAAAGVAAHAHPPACARMPATVHSYAEGEAFSGSPRSDNYRLEFARGRSPRTPRPPRLLPHSPASSTSGSELSLRQPIKIREPKEEDAKEPAIVPTLRPSGPSRTTVAIR